MSNPSQHESLLAGGVLSPLPPGRRIVRGQGGRVWDDRGTAYTDLVLGYGAVSLGHGEPGVVEAVAAQAARGTMLPGKTREEEQVVASLRKLFPHTTAASLHKTGSEAVAAAIRIARCVKRRDLVVRCGFHGWHDEMMQVHRRWHDAYGPAKTPPSLVPGVRNAPAPLEWLDGEARTLASILEAHRGQVAAVILDPVQVRERVPETLAETVEICSRADVLLILDELKTCPRVALGGIQATCGVTADLTIVGKGLANGFPFSAVLGPDYVDDIRRESRIMGTFNGELSGLAAVLATVKVLQREDAPRQLAELGNEFAAQTNQSLAARNLDGVARVVCEPWSCMPRILLASLSYPVSNLPVAAAKHSACVLSPHVTFVCLRHTMEDVKRSARAIAAAIGELQRGE